MTELKQNSFEEHHKCSDKLKVILNTEAEKLSVDDILSILGQKGFYLFIIILCLPMMLPTPGLPGISQSFGTIIFLLSIQIMQGKESISLPQKIHNLQINKSTLDKVLRKMIPLIEKVEARLKERIPLFTGKFSKILFGIISILCIMPIVLPFPFSNSLPACAIFLMCLAELEKDGLFFIYGIITTILGYLLIAAIAIFGVSAILALFKSIF